MGMEARLAPLGEGVYSVSEVCRILQPTMTPRKVHYWLDTGLISGAPVAYGGPGRPTLLTFRQLLEIRTVQHLRDELAIGLPKVRDTFDWILRHAFDTETAVSFSRGAGGEVVVHKGDDSFEIATGQSLLPDLETMNRDLALAREAWLEKRLRLRDNVVADTRILAGAPTLLGTRIETSIVATFACDGTYDEDVIVSALQTYPHVSREAVSDAFAFEGIRRAA